MHLKNLSYPFVNSQNNLIRRYQGFEVCYIEILFTNPKKLQKKIDKYEQMFYSLFRTFVLKQEDEI